MEGFGQQELRYILRLRWYGRVLVNTVCDGRFVRAGMGGFCVLAGMRLVWSTHVEMNFMNSLAREGLRHRWH
jgi:hypothetical protein